MKRSALFVPRTAAIDARIVGVVRPSPPTSPRRAGGRMKNKIIIVDPFVEVVQSGRISKEVHWAGTPFILDDETSKRLQVGVYELILRRRKGRTKP